jgi:hypothetical protein
MCGEAMIDAGTLGMAGKSLGCRSAAIWVADGGFGQIRRADVGSPSIPSLSARLEDAASGAFDSVIVRTRIPGSSEGFVS